MVYSSRGSCGCIMLNGLWGVISDIIFENGALREWYDGLYSYNGSFLQNTMIDDGEWLVVPVWAPSNADHMIIGSSNNG